MNEASSEYVDARLDAILREQDLLRAFQRDMAEEVRRAVDLSEKTTQERTRVALEAIQARLDILNEFRGSLEDSLKNNVNRDLFDIVTNRVTVVENTYVKRADYVMDADRLRERFTSELQSRDQRIAELERTSVREAALGAQKDEVDRTRKALVYAIVVGAVLTIINFVVNAVQVAETAP